MRLSRCETGLSLQEKYFSGRSKAVLLLWIIFVTSVLFLLCFRAHLFIDDLWSTAAKGLTSWLSFVISNCEVVIFQLVSWVRCEALLYRFLIFAIFLTLIHTHRLTNSKCVIVFSRTRYMLEIRCHQNRYIIAVKYINSHKHTKKKSIKNKITTTNIS